MLTLLPKLPRAMVRSIVGVWRRRWIVAAVAWLAALVTWAAIALLPDMYESRAQVYINTDTALDATIAEVGARPNLEKSVRIIRTQLLSNDNIEQVLYETGLDAGLRGPVELERKVRQLAGEISVESEEEQYYVIRYLDKDPVVAQRVVAAVLDLFIEQNLGSAIADTNKALATLDREIAERLKDLDAIDARIATFRRLNADELAGAGRLARRLETGEDELGRIQDQLAATSVRRQGILSELAGTKRFTSGSDVDTLKTQLASLQSQFNDNYPDIQRLKAQIAELESGSSALPTNAVYLELERSLRATDDELRSLRARADRIQSEIDTAAISVAQTPEAESELVALLRDKEQVEGVYKQLVSERAEIDLFANLNQAGGAVEYRRFEAPKVAAEPTFPQRGLLTALGVALALGAGVAIAFVLTQLDRTYTQSSDLEQALGLQVLGSVSPAPTPSARLRILADRALLAGVFGMLAVTAAGLYWWHEMRIEGDAGAVRSAAIVETGVRTPEGVR